MIIAKPDYTPLEAQAEMHKLCTMIGPHALMSIVILDREDRENDKPLRWSLQPVGFRPGSEYLDFRGRASSFRGAVYGARMAWLGKGFHDPEEALEAAAICHGLNCPIDEDRAIDTDRLRDDRDERRRLAKEYPDNE